MLVRVDGASIHTVGAPLVFYSVLFTFGKRSIVVWVLSAFFSKCRSKPKWLDIFFKSKLFILNFDQNSLSSKWTVFKDF